MVGLAGVELHILALVLLCISFNLRIGIEGIASLVLAGVAGTFHFYIRPQLRGRGLAVSNACVLTVQAGFQQLNLHVAYGEGVRCGLGIRQVSQSTQHGCNGHQNHQRYDCNCFLHCSFSFPLFSCQALPGGYLQALPLFAKGQDTVFLLIYLASKAAKAASQLSKPFACMA